MAVLKPILVIALAGYLGITALMYFTQRSIMYRPETVRTPLDTAGIPDAQETVLDTADGEKLVVWQIPPRGDKPVILYFHGNGGALRHRIDRFRKLAADGVGVVALSYRGFGGSTGTPSEVNLINDARAVYDLAVSRYPGARIVPWGESLGTGVAVALAAEKPVAKLILQAPYTSAVAVAGARYPFLPVRLLMKDQFRSDERIRQVKAPVLIMHGEADEVIPIGYGERLLAMVPGEKRMVRFPRGSHVDLDRLGAADTALRFLAE